MSATKKIMATAAALGVLLLSSGAAAEPPTTPEAAEQLPTPHVRLTTGPGTLRTNAGRLFDLPVMTHVLAPPAWDKLDAEMKRLQDAETRLTAENKSLRAQAGGWRPGWRLIATTLVVGTALGAYGRSKL